MKRIGGLFSEIVDRRGLAAAAWRAALGKRERVVVRSFLEEAAQLNGLAEELLAGRFTFSPYRSFAIRDPKTRTIHSPAFRDRVVHHAMIAATGPVFELGATDRSYACRKGRGQHAAIARVRGWMVRTDWFLKVDIKRYYDSVSHELLMTALWRRFRESRVLGLFERLLESHCSRAGFGLPIGALTSQYLGNFYLDTVDNWVLRTAGIPRYVRYMDDMLFMGSRSQMGELSRALPRVLEGLGLVAKHALCPNSCSLGVPFLGYTLYADRMRLDGRGRRRLRRKFGTLEEDYRKGSLGVGELQARAESLFAHARHADDQAWRAEVLRFSRLGDELETDEPRPARRLVEQHGQELPLRVSQQEQGRQPQQEQRFSRLSVSRHEGEDSPPDVVHSRASASTEPGDKSMRKASPAPDICSEDAEKAAGEAASVDDKEAGS